MKRHQIEVLYVRWMAPLAGYPSGMGCAKLLKVAFVDESDHDAFGFLDPDDWEAYYIGMNMLMHYTPHGIGHSMVVQEILQDCTNVELMDSTLSEEDKTNEDGHHCQEHGIQPCECDAEQGGNDDDNKDGSDDDDNDNEESD
ncbi:hypothetical protein BDR04DRAFT_1117229 [Suillus decipiens]|nr:hypothetical protein BDR04DRAFT_1117229 [Suillus decipiens]